MRRSELGRRINGVSELLPSPESIIMALHHLFVVFMLCFHKTHSFEVFLSFGMVWFSNETIMNIELFIILKIENWPIQVARGIKGGDRFFKSSMELETPFLFINLIFWVINPFVV